MNPETPFSDGLPLALDDLLQARAIESNRIEFKAGWTPQIKAAAVRTVCAFANDLLNLGGGYIVLGVQEEQARAVLPPAGLAQADLDQVQKEIRWACERIQPTYQPLVFPALYSGIPLVVIWAPGGDTRPYQAPEDLNVKGSPLHYYVRRGPETLQAKGDTLLQLLQLTAKVPFDDRRNLQAGVEHLSASLVRRFLHDVGSDLVRQDPPLPEAQIYRQMNLLVRINGHEVPRNVALLFFSEDPDRFFPGARIEVVQFGDGAGGDLIEERIFRGPLSDQVRNVLQYLDSLGGTMLRKIPGQAEVERTVPYPYEAMEEVLVNAVYHRSYEEPPEPIKVYLYPDRMEITSYPGPVHGIEPEHFAPGSVLPAVPTRNRRIGDFLKELRLAERRGTGIPKIQRKMRENGSPEARFDFDTHRTYFRATLPVHPRYRVIHALREAGHLWVTGERRPALQLLERSFEQLPREPALATQIIDYALTSGDEALARRTLDTFRSAGGDSVQPFLPMARFLIDRHRYSEAVSLLERVPPVRSVEDTIEAAILKKRAQDFEGAHRLFAEAYSLQPDDPELLQEFAQTKMELAQALGPETDVQVRRRLYREATELSRKAIQLTDDPARRAWSWLDLAITLERLESSPGEIEAAYRAALALLPGEPRLREAYDSWQSRTGSR